MCLVVTLMAVDSAKNKEFVSSDMPPQSGDDPLEVTTSLFFDDISTFNDRLMQYNIDYYLRHKWIVEADKCAIYGKMLARTKTNTSKTQSDEIVMNSGQVCKIFWCPDTFLVEGKFTRMPSRITSMKVLILHMDDSDGTCLMEYYVKLSTVVSCPMNFRKYPADVQTCVMTFRSFSYGEDMLELHWAPKEIEPIRIDPGMKLHQHRVGFRYTEAVVQRDSVNLSALVVNFMFKRQMSNTLIRTYSPSAMVVILSWFSFWMALDAIPARVTLCVTSLLALVTQFANEQEDLPAVSYVNVSYYYFLRKS
ncbi:Glycine receptor subunit alpha-3 [Halotydeus destructor]|nr:Glycine receptor subunit alpha-3 [Halotydeus destructor]